MGIEAKRVVGFKGDRLRKLRGEMSQGDLAEAIGVHQQEVSDWELGKKIPETPNVIKLLNYFKDVRSDYLFNLVDEPDAFQETPSQPEFIEDLANAIAENDLSKLMEIVARLRQENN